MKRKQLTNKPLMEAMLEIRWKIPKNSSGQEIDPNYRLLPGRLFDRIEKKYPEHEPLPTVHLPDEMVGHIVQHRFRVAVNAWPLIQVGPGVLTVNSTDDYKWSDFSKRAVSAKRALYDVYPNVEELKIISMKLQYINGVVVDLASEGVFEFLKDKLQWNVTLPEDLFKGTAVTNRPKIFRWQGSFECKHPRGVVSVQFATGQKGNEPAVIWDTTVESVGDDLPEMPNAFEEWLNAAHTIAGDWFFKMIEGDLERRFSGE